MFGWWRRPTAAPIDDRLRAAPPTVPLWVSPGTARPRRYLAPGTRVHLYASDWHRSMMRPRFGYSVPVRVRVDSPLGAAVTVGQRLVFFLPREEPWVIVPVAEDPAPYWPPDVA